MVKESQKFDVRTIERKVREGNVSQKEYQEYLDNLPDVADKAEKIESEFVAGVLEDEEQEEENTEEDA